MRSSLATRLRRVTRVDQPWGEELVRTCRERSGPIAALLRQVFEATRSRINAPLVRPRGFTSIREYRAWKAQRRNRAPGSPLHWPLGVWLTIGFGVIFWII